jgi:hypothetical protein
MWAILSTQEIIPWLCAFLVPSVLSLMPFYTPGQKATILQNAIQDHFGIVHSRAAFEKKKKPTLIKWN